MQSKDIQKTTNGAEEFRSRGIRLTKTRLLLFDILQNADRPQSVPELLVSCAKRKVTPHKTTLYREIEHLVVWGIVNKVQLSETRVSYELATDHHHHFVCERCSGVTKLSFCEKMMTSLTVLLQQQGKQITHHNFEFFGLCELCISKL